MKLYGKPGEALRDTRVMGFGEAGEDLRERT
ncbi:hypothetical protein PT2222_100192 [Paraburkholderia tropica]